MSYMTNKLPDAGFNVPRRDQVRVLLIDYLDEDCGGPGYVYKTVLGTVVPSLHSYPQIELEGLPGPFPVIPAGTRSLCGVRRRLWLSCVTGCGATVHPADHDRVSLLYIQAQRDLMGD